VTEQAVIDGRKIGLCGDIAARIRRMARQSAPITHEQGNCRFDNFVMLISGGEVLHINRMH